MKKGVGVGLGSSIFILLVISVLALVRPVYLRLDAAVKNFEQSLSETLKEKTGLSISYKSLSPSIFVSASIKKIQVSDIASGKALLTVNKATLSYSVSRFFSKEPLLAFKTLTLNGVNIEFDSVKDTAFLEKLNGNSEKTDSPKENEKFSLDGRNFDLPFDVIVKNVSVHYSDKQNDALVSLKKISFKDFNDAEGLSVNTSGRAKLSSELIPAGRGRGTVAFNFSLSGNLFSDFNGSSAMLSLSEAGGADYSVSNLNMLVNYSSNVFEFRTMRTVLPFSLYAMTDISRGEVKLIGDFDNFDPFRLVSIRKKTPLMQKISGSLISGRLGLSLLQKKISYDSDLKLNLSKKIVGSPLQLTLDFDGDTKFVNLSKIAASGDFVDADFSGSFDIEKLQPSGTFSLNFFTLGNGNIISTEVYGDPVKNGFMCFAPQLFLNEKSFTALQFQVFPKRTSVDFSFELDDYAHAEYGESGHIAIDGSFLTGSEKFLQAQLSISSVFIDSLVDAAAFFGNESMAVLLKNVSNAAEPYLLNTEAYISSDLKDFSINAPACLIANSRKDRELLIFAADGSKETFNISQFDLQFGSMEAHAQAAVDFAENLKEFSFVTDLTVNSIPYRFNGNVSPGWISVSGDYNFDAVVSIDDSIFGNVTSSKFPVAAGKNVLAFSLDTSFNWNKDDGISAEIASFELEEPSGNLTFAPRLAFSGSANRHGFMFNTFAYSDMVSNLDGEGSIVWNLNEGIFDSIHAILNGQSLISSERFSFNVDFTNPAQLPFSGEALMNDFYMSVESEIHNFPMARFMDGQTNDNSVSAFLTASGTISNPFISVTLQRASVNLYGYPLTASASLVYDDTGLNLSDLNGSWSMINVSNFNAFFDPSQFEGNASALLNIKLNEKNIEAPVEFLVRGETDGKKFAVPEFFNMELSSKKVEGNFFASTFPFKISAMRTPGRFDIFAEDAEVFRASFSNGGSIEAHAGGNTIKFDLAGTIIGNKLNLEAKGIYADFKKISSEIQIPGVHFNSGILSGALKLTGLTTDPEFTGAFNASKVNLMVPMISKSAFSADKIFMTVGQGEAVVKPTQIFLGKGYGMIGTKLEFNRWKLDSIDTTVQVPDEHKVPIELSVPFVFIKGEGSCDLDILYTNPGELEISGWIVGDNTNVEFVTTAIQSQFSLDNITGAVPVKSENEEGMHIITDLNITVGQKVQVLFNPLLRGVAAPGTPLRLYMDTDGDFEIQSDISLRGGEIAWLNRNFYMKEGRVVLNESRDKMDPRITVHAETRERDENGNIITIILSAENEPISSFNPRFTASPAKSEQEIMALLGQVIAADSENIAQVATAGGDYLLQATVMRRIENTLRELLNFDIFSIRTNVLQNSLKLTMDRNTANKQVSIGNFIDNSTVYVGKYFGSSIYVDTLLHWTYDENKAENGATVNDIVFQPEVGFEMSSPYVNIRLGVAPDIDALRKGDLGMWVPATSMTLSWKYSF
ncbi:MAG: hypothetical protein KBT11_05250 [Treponema sp.]|nr:hypothetical protein [Candidatus Treponema equifaecale]